MVNAYVTVITDQQVLALDESNQEVLEQQLEATNDQFNVGEITETSVAQAQASLAQAKEQVEVAYGNLQIGGKISGSWSGIILAIISRRHSRWTSGLIQGSCGQSRDRE